MVSTGMRRPKPRDVRRFLATPWVTSHLTTDAARRLDRPRLYLAPPTLILEVLARQDDAFHDILVCGHNPGLTDLANRLTGASIGSIPPCGLVVIEAPITQWCDLDAGARLVLFDYPGRPPAS